MVGVLYGDEDDLSSFYKTINENYPVYVGQEFWTRLTGSDTFYHRLTDAIAEISSEFNGTVVLKEAIDGLSMQIKNEEVF